MPCLRAKQLNRNRFPDIEEKLHRSCDNGTLNNCASLTRSSKQHPQRFPFLLPVIYPSVNSREVIDGVFLEWNSANGRRLLADVLLLQGAHTRASYLPSDVPGNYNGKRPALLFSRAETRRVSQFRKPLLANRFTSPISHIGLLGRTRRQRKRILPRNVRSNFIEGGCENSGEGCAICAIHIGRTFINNNSHLLSAMLARQRVAQSAFPPFVGATFLLLIRIAPSSCKAPTGNRGHNLATRLRCIAGELTFINNNNNTKLLPPACRDDLELALCVSLAHRERTRLSCYR